MGPEDNFYWILDHFEYYSMYNIKYHEINRFIISRYSPLYKKRQGLMSNPTIYTDYSKFIIRLKNFNGYRNEIYEQSNLKRLEKKINIPYSCFIDKSKFIIQQLTTIINKYTIYDFYVYS